MYSLAIPSIPNNKRHRQKFSFIARLFQPHLDLHRATFRTVRHVEASFPISLTLSRALPRAGTLFQHPRRIITEVSRNARAVRRLRIAKHPRRTPFGQSAANKEGTKGAAG